MSSLDGFSFSPDVFARRLPLFTRLHQMYSPAGFSSLPGFARCLRLPTLALRQPWPSKPEGWVSGDLHSDSDGPRAFGRWPKVATHIGGHLAGPKGAFAEAGAPAVGPHYRFVGRRCGAACWAVFAYGRSRGAPLAKGWRWPLSAAGRSFGTCRTGRSQDGGLKFDETKWASSLS